MVATPIGNLDDLSPRARTVLAGADLVLAEDSRVARRLLQSFGAAPPIETYNDLNGAKVRPRILERLAGGAAVALTSDAGTPLISDPGYRLVDEARRAGLAVHAVPGPSAAIAALSVAGLPTDRFLFLGFLPPKAAARRRAIAEVASVPATLVLYESANRLSALLADLAAGLGPRPAAVARELTKLYEEVRRAPLDELAEAYGAAEPPKGEIVVLVAPPAPAAVAPERIDELLRAAPADETTRDAVDRVARATGAPRKEVYRRALGLRRDEEA